MSEVKKVPEIRFEGFSKPWEQRKLLSLCDKFTDGDWIEAKDQSNSGVRLIQTGNVGVAEYLDKPNNKKWVSKETFEALHCEEVFEGDILISRLPEPAGRACIVPNIGTKMITAVDCTIVRVSKNISNEFLLQYLSSQKYFDEVNACLAGGTRQRVSRSNLANFNIPVPAQKQEQQVIGHFCRYLDNLITLHQRKYEKLVTLKQAMLEKMFSQNGSNVPEVRFTGFTGSWEQRKLGDLTNILSASRVHKDEWRTSGVPFFRSSDVMAAFNGTQNEKAFIDPSLFEKLSAISGKPEKGDLFITGGGSVGIPYIVPNDEPLYSKDADLIWIKHNPNTDPDFLYTYFVSPFFRKYLMSISHVGTIAHYTIEQVKATPIYLPEIDEQMKIGTLFRNLDTLITLQQRKCESLKHIKAALLQKMFV